NDRATPSAIVAITAAAATKITGSSTQMGSAGDPNHPVSVRWGPNRVTPTGNARTNRTKAARTIGAWGNRSTGRPARRNPTPIPRKLASRTKFVKYARYTTL